MDIYYRVICFDAQGWCAERYALGISKARKIADEYFSARIEKTNWAPSWHVETVIRSWSGDVLDVVQVKGYA